MLWSLGISLCHCFWALLFPKKFNNDINFNQVKYALMEKYSHKEDYDSGCEKC